MAFNESCLKLNQKFVTKVEILNQLSGFKNIQELESVAIEKLINISAEFSSDLIKIIKKHLLEVVKMKTMLAINKNLTIFVTV